MGWRRFLAVSEATGASAKAVKEVKQGKIDFKVDKAGIIHTSIGKVSMTPEQIYGNAKEFINTVIKLNPLEPISWPPWYHPGSNGP